MEIFWSFQGGPLGSHLGLKTAPLGARVSVLLVEPVSPSNRGGELFYCLRALSESRHLPAVILMYLLCFKEYTCTARNAAGTADASAFLQVYGSSRSSHPTHSAAV
jgi:hypothetical protein